MDLFMDLTWDPLYMHASISSKMYEVISYRLMHGKDSGCNCYSLSLVLDKRVLSHQALANSIQLIKSSMQLPNYHLLSLQL